MNLKDNFDEPVQSQKTSVFVIPANAGIQFWARSSWIFPRPTVNRQLETGNFHINIASEEASHESGQGLPPGTEKKMGMIG